jgi:uncharacterized RDD family membrane protein YckC
VSDTAIPDTNGGETHCPVCERTRPARKLRRRLYDVPVCNKCRNAFANRRQAAYLIDTLAWGLVISLPLTYLEQFFYGNASPPGFPLLRYLGLDTALGFVASWILPLFFFCKDGFHGMSLGKWLMGVQVVDVHTREPVGFGRSFKRNLVLLVPFGLLIVATTMMKGKRWGDRWAQTVVIWRKHAYKLPFDPRGVLCTGCGYDLTGNVSGRCPECFTPVLPGSSSPSAAPQELSRTF